MHNTNQHGSRARLQHSNHPPSLPTPNWVITRSSQLTQTECTGPRGALIRSGRRTAQGAR